MKKKYGNHLKLLPGGKKYNTSCMQKIIYASSPNVSIFMVIWRALYRKIKHILHEQSNLSNFCNLSYIT